jgi:hypothetical protein
VARNVHAFIQRLGSVRVAEKPNARLASCCKVDVMNGGEGWRRRLPFSIFVMV